MAAAVTCPEPTCTGRVSDTSTCSSTSEAGLRLGGGGTTSDPQGTGPKRRRVHGAVEHPESYYYRRVFTDAVRAVQVVRTISRVDRAKVSVARISQGGGISLAVAGLVNDLFAVTRRTRHFCATSNVRWTSVNEARTQRSADTSRSTVGRPEEPLTL